MEEHKKILTTSSELKDDKKTCLIKQSDFSKFVNIVNIENTYKITCANEILFDEVFESIEQAEMFIVENNIDVAVMVSLVMSKVMEKYNKN